QLEDGAVAPSKRRRRIRHLEQPPHLVYRQVRWNLAFELWRSDEMIGALGDESLTSQIAHEPTQRRQFPRRRGTGALVGVQVGGKGADHVAPEILRLEVGQFLLVEIQTRELEELADIGRVRGQRVR